MAFSRKPGIPFDDATSPSAAGSSWNRRREFLGGLIRAPLLMRLPCWVPGAGMMLARGLSKARMFVGIRNRGNQGAKRLVAESCRRRLAAGQGLRMPSRPIPAALVQITKLKSIDTAAGLADDTI